MTTKSSSHRIDGYSIKKKLGSGGMATVYLAVQTSLGRKVALKLLSPNLIQDSSSTVRFLREARTIADLSHPNIISIYDVGTTNRHLPYFTMQYLPGGDLSERLKREIHEKEIIRILIGVTEALGYAHRRNFIHRDVKPANILFDESDNPVLTDFGIARTITGSNWLTGSGRSVGSSHYMSPEQTQGVELDARSDIYSLGVVAYQALVGRAPYEADDDYAIGYAHVYNDIPEVPERLERWQAFIDRAMAKDPDERFQSTDEVLSALNMLMEQTSAIGRAALPAEAVTVELPAASDEPSGSSQPEMLTQEVEPETTFQQNVETRQTELQRSFAETLQLKQFDPEQLSDGSSASPDPSETAATAPDRDTENDASQNAVADEDRITAERKAATDPRPVKYIIFAAAAVIVAVLGVILYAILSPSDEDGGTTEVVSTDTGETDSTPAIDTDNENVTVADDTTEPVLDVQPDSTTTSLVDNSTVPIDEDFYSSTEDDADNLVMDHGFENIIDDEADSGEGETEAYFDDLFATTILDTTNVTLDEESDEDGMSDDVMNQIHELLTLAVEDLEENRLTTPRDSNAFSRYQSVLQLQADNPVARDGIGQIVGKYIGLARINASRTRFDNSHTYIRRARQVMNATSISDRSSEVDRINQQTIELARDAASKQLEKGDTTTARRILTQLLLFLPEDEQALAMIHEIDNPVPELPLVFSDEMKSGGQGPLMRRIMNEDTELYAIGLYEVTLEQFESFSQSSSYRQLKRNVPCRDQESIWRSSKRRTWSNPGFQQSVNHPVTCVNYHTAVAFAGWLSAETGQTYRLPSESEWNRAASIQSSQSASCENSNLADQQFKKLFPDESANSCNDGYAHTAPVNGNETGVNSTHMNGNLREWTLDCATSSTGCEERIVAGASWLQNLTPDEGFATRLTVDPDRAFNTIGFRILREASN